MTGFFAHPNALVESQKIGEATRIWAFAHVLPGAVIGRDCNVCDHVFIENDVILGDRVTIKSGVQLWDGISIEDDVFVGPNATFTNDPFPRSRHPREFHDRIILHRGASVGANATILPGVKVGRYAMVGAGAVVTHDVPPYAIVVGNPAQITGYVQSGRESPQAVASSSVPPSTQGPIGVKGVQLHEFPLVLDLRGNLTYAEYDRSLPFVPHRYFLVFGVTSREIRGEHAHRQCHQLLVCVKGSCSVMIDDGHNRAEVLLDRPNLGLHVPPMVWAAQYKYSGDAVLLVLASDEYDPEDYIRDYDQFLREVGAA